MGPGCPRPEAAEVTNVSFMQSTQALRYQRMGRAVGGAVSRGGGIQEGLGGGDLCAGKDVPRLSREKKCF